MSIDTQFGATLALPGSETASETETKVASLRQAILDLATSYDQGEIGQQEFMAALKPLNAELRRQRSGAFGSSVRRSESRRRRRPRRRPRSASPPRRRRRRSRRPRRSIGSWPMPRLRRHPRRIANEAELEALAIAHGIEMMEHEERELQQLTAAREQDNASINREIEALEAAERERLQQAGAVTQETAAESRAREATERETNALWLEVAALENAEREALQFANAEFAAAGAMEHFAVDASAAASASGRLATAAGGVRRGMGSTRQSITAASYAFQDFTATSGDLGAKLNSISNNLPTLLIGLGGLGTILSVTATAGIALYRNWNDIAGFWETREPFTKGAQDIAGMKRELDNAKEATEKLEKAGTGNAEQIAKYNKLIETTARLEKDIADQQERQNLLKKLREAPNEEQEGRAKGFTEATKGTDFESKLTQAYANDINNQVELEHVGLVIRLDAIKQSNKTDAEKAAATKAELDSYSATIRRLRDPANDPAKLAEDLYVRLAKGEQAAFTALDRLMGETGVVFGDLRQKMAAANPHIKALVDDAIREIEGWADGQDKAAKAENAAQKKGQAVAGHALDVDLKAQVADAVQGKKADTVLGKLGGDLEDMAVDRQTAFAKSSGLVPQAESALAQAQAQGLNPAQQAAFVKRLVAQELKRRNPKTDPQQRALTAARITAMGQESLEKDVQANIGLATQTVGAMGGLNAQQAQQQAQILALQAVVAKINRDANARAANNRKRGNGG